jgi:hypothetical protein
VLSRPRIAAIMVLAAALTVTSISTASAAQAAKPLAAISVKSTFLAAAGSPSSNIAPSPAYPSVCQSAPSGQACQDSAIAALNHARAVMGQPAYALPAGFESLSAAMQFLVLANSDRAIYGLSQIAGLNDVLSSAAQAGIAADNDPTGPAVVNGSHFTSWTSNWAAGWSSSLYTYYEWMYDDGIGSSNIDCSSTNGSGCWGHRLGTLHDFGNSFVAMGVGSGLSPHYGSMAFTELFEGFAPGSSIPVSSPAPAPAPAPLATGVADVTGDGKADFVSIYYPAGVYVQPSSGSSFGGVVQWSNQTFYGTRATFLADVNGDGKADVVAVNDSSVWVMLSTGSGFTAPQPWSSSYFYGSRLTVAGDVNGDHRADLVAVNNNGGTWVMLSTGSGFTAPQPWTGSLFYGTRITTVQDVNGDGKADAIAVNDGSVWVMLSNGAGFGAPQLWSGSYFFGARTTTVADVNGDGKADAVAINNSSIWVMLSTGSGLTAPQLWSNTLFYGSQATVAGDLNGDHKADVVAVNARNLFVEISTGAGLGAVAAWY